MTTARHSAAASPGVMAFCPAKLNLFFELLKRRSDGFHDVDTVMVAIDLFDELHVRPIDEDEILLDVEWLPSRSAVAGELGLDASSDAMLDIPVGRSNLVYRAIEMMSDRFRIRHGFRATLKKRIPSGAGMGGASSDAAMALLCVASLCDLPSAGSPSRDPRVREIAEELGSDVPFFLGPDTTPMGGIRVPDERTDGCAKTVVQSHLEGEQSNTGADVGAIAWATGRGECLRSVPLACGPLHFVIVYPATSLSTPLVFAESTVPDDPQSSEPLRNALSTLGVSQFGQFMANRLSEPAKKIAPQIGEIHETMWQSGLKAVQLTGSGSASFAVLPTRDDAELAAKRLRAQFAPGARVMVATSTSVPTTLIRQQL
ncbi:MAG: 4-(cytidine 5'-diphospho)-2-C-methyl-D-erythritol kinase [Planctomycetota bacterium]